MDMYPAQRHVPDEMMVEHVTHLYKAAKTSLFLKSSR
jgi:hypothetical protein